MDACAAVISTVDGNQVLCAGKVGCRKRTESALEKVRRPSRTSSVYVPVIQPGRAACDRQEIALLTQRCFNQAVGVPLDQ